ncbi:MAG: polysaccharide biosynthesis C-terminal domain-containing protein, partial [bacterium]|nr:polysaccharide biosynthesis C-terminal domain-containing protein [bacterium]
PEYSAAAGILRIYAWSNIGMFLGTAINYRLIAENKEKFIFLTQTILVVVNVALNLILLPLLGMAGSAIATLISYSLWPIQMSLNKQDLSNN